MTGKVDRAAYGGHIFLMPRGTHHRLTGLLLSSPRGLILRVDDGGEWALDTNHTARRLLGRRVTVEGVRSGFDLLDVERISPA